MWRTLVSAVAVLVLLTGRVAADDGEAVKRPRGLTLSAGLPSSEFRVEQEGAADWLLPAIPPLEALATVRPEWSDDLVGDRPQARRRDRPPGPVSYGLGDNWRAAIGYHHELLFPTAAGKDLRNRKFSLFAAQPDRDVLDMKLFWLLPWSELNFGYQLQSDRAALAAAGQSYSLGSFVDETFDYALTIGFTRRWGGSD
jgi:hypothetical protein